MRSFFSTLALLIGAAFLGGATMAMTSMAITKRNPFERPAVIAQAVFNPATVTPRTRVVYVRRGFATYEEVLLALKNELRKNIELEREQEKD